MNAREGRWHPVWGCLMAVGLLVFVCVVYYRIDKLEERGERQAESIEALEDFRQHVIGSAVGVYHPAGSWSGEICYQHGVWWLFREEDEWRVALKLGGSPYWSRGDITGVFTPDDSRNGELFASEIGERISLVYGGRRI